MFSGGKKNRGASHSTTLVAAGTIVSGNITFDGNVEVEGCVKGDIEALDLEYGVITVLTDGVVEGQIRAPNIVINGKVEGDVVSGSHVELAANAMVTGNVHYHLIEMVKGAQVNGNLVYSGDSEADEGSSEAENPDAGQDTLLD